MSASESVSASLFETAFKLAEQRGLAAAGGEVKQQRVAFFEELQVLEERLDAVLNMTLKRTLAEEI